MRITLVVCFALTELVACNLARGAASTPADRYSVTRLDSGRGPGWTMHPRAMNENGEIAGVLTHGADNLPFFWSPSSGLRVLPGIDGGTYSGGSAVALNDLGQVIGAIDGRAFIWSAAEGTRAVGGPTTTVFGINNSGVVSGYEGEFPPSPVGITGFRLYPDGRKETLTVAGYSATPVEAINNRGDAIGRLVGEAGGAPDRPIVWNADGSPRDLPPVPGDPVGFLGADAINDNGWVVADRYLATPDGRVTDLGTLYGPESLTMAFALNNAGLVVGEIGGQGPELARAFAWSEQTGIVGLNERLDATGTGWVLMGVAAVNESGQMAGIGQFNGQLTGYVLTPVPEPGAMAMVGAAGLICLRRRSRNR